MYLVAVNVTVFDLKVTTFPGVPKGGLTTTARQLVQGTFNVYHIALSVFAVVTLFRRKRLDFV